MKKRDTKRTSADAKCPFYKRETANKIFCESFLDESGISLNFVNARDSRIYKNYSCYSVMGYQKCPIFRMLEKEFENE